MSLFNREKDGAITSVNESYTLEQICETDTVQFMAAALMEGCTEEEMMELIQEATTNPSADTLEVLVERSIVKLDKPAKKNQAFKIALLQTSREKGDKEYKKLVSLWKLEKILMAKIEKKRRSEAEKRARVIYKQMISSKKSKVANAGNKGAKILKPVTTKVK